MKCRMIKCFVMLMAFGILSTAAWAEVPGQINYQGFLTDPEGIPIGIDPPAEVQMWFSIYDQETDGAEMWSEGPLSVTVDGGIFNVILGQTTPITPDLIDGPCWLEVIVDGGEGGEYLVPREMIVSSLFAIKAKDADTVDGMEGADLEESAEIDVDISAHAAISDVHHTKTTSFSELTDLATDTQIPDDITVTYAVTAGDADTIDGMEGVALEESAEIDADISSHTYDPSAHHARYTDIEAVAAGQDEFVNKVGDIITGDLSILGNELNVAGVIEISGVGLVSADENGLTLDTVAAQNVRILPTLDVGGVGLVSADENGLTLDTVAAQNVRILPTLDVGGVGLVSADENGLTLDTVAAQNVRILPSLNVGFGTFFVNHVAGNVGIGTTSPTSRLHVIGTTTTDVLTITGGSDIAEPFDIKEPDKIKPGLVLSIDPDNPGKLKLSDKPYDRCVAGIVSGAGGINPGITLTQEESVDSKSNVALSGRVFGLCDASHGSIQPGDLLTTSPNPGYAMKAADNEKSHGAILGKAMTELKEGEGLVLVLVTLH